MQRDTDNIFKVRLTNYALDAAATFESGSDNALSAGRERASAFPKSANVKGGTLSAHAGYLDGLPFGDPRVPQEPNKYSATGFVPQSQTFSTTNFQAKIRADGANGGVNETGTKRFRTFARAAERLGYRLVFDDGPMSDRDATAAQVYELTGIEVEEPTAR